MGKKILTISFLMLFLVGCPKPIPELDIDFFACQKDIGLVRQNDNGNGYTLVNVNSNNFNDYIAMSYSDFAKMTRAYHKCMEGQSKVFSLPGKCLKLLNPF